MALTSKSAGSQTATVDTEHTLAIITDAGTYVLTVDAADLVNDETVTLRIKTKVRAADTSRLVYVEKLTADLPLLGQRDFINRFTVAEREAFIFAKNDAGNAARRNAIDAFLDYVRSDSVVNIREVYVIDSVNSMEPFGLIGAGRAAIILDETGLVEGVFKPNKQAPAVPVISEGIFTLEQNGGTGRVFPWNILQLDG